MNKGEHVVNPVRASQWWNDSRPWKNVQLGCTREELENELVKRERWAELNLRNPSPNVYDDGPTGAAIVGEVSVRVGGRITFNVWPPSRAIEVIEAKNPHAKDEA